MTFDWSVYTTIDYYSIMYAIPFRRKWNNQSVLTSINNQKYVSVINTIMLIVIVIIIIINFVSYSVEVAG